ncbi:hypothetical protein ACFY36_47920 [Actinoplanes sp. NPDC000266]
MSYDLTFLDKPAELSWEEVLEALGEDDSSGEAPDEEAWANLRGSAREILGRDVTEHGSARFRGGRLRSGFPGCRRLLAEEPAVVGEAGGRLPHSWARGGP